MQNRLIVALDVPNLDQGKKLISLLGDEIVYYKVGLELFLNSNGEIIEYLKKQNKNIFLDLKFHDIPNTVAAAARWAVSLGVDMFNIHVGGGEEMLLSTKEIVAETAIKEGVNPPIVLGVTVLTSFNERGFKALGFQKTIAETVLDWAVISQKSGLDGVVCSALEAGKIKEVCGADFFTVCPGVRPMFAGKGDQKRVMTPAEALKNGADYLVIGRPINAAINPLQAAKKIIAEMEIEK